MKTILIVFGALLFIGSPVAQTKFKPEWTVIAEFTSESPDVPTDMTVDMDDNIIVIGDTGQKYVNGTWLQSDWFVAKFDSSGRELWRHIYDGGRNWEDIPRDVKTHHQGDVFVTGRSRRPGWSPPQYTTIRFRGSDGAILWISSYHDPVTRSGTDPAGFVIDAHGDLIVAGELHAGYDNNWVTVKMDGRNGHVLWSRVYDHRTLQDWVSDVALDLGGNPIVSGTVYEELPWLHSDLFVTKYSANDGSTLWQTQWDSYGLLCKNGGGRIVFGHQGEMFTTGGGCALIDGQMIVSGQIIRWDSSTGRMLWVAQDPVDDSGGGRLIVGNDGHPICAGFHGWRDDAGNDHSAWMALKAHRDTGQILWRSSWFQTGNRERHENRLEAIVSHPNGKLYAAGYLAGQVVDAALMEIDPDTGSMRLLDVYYGSSQRRDAFTHMKVLSDGSLVAVGLCTEQYSVGGNDLLIRKYIEVPLADVNEDLQVDDADLAFVLSVFGFYHPDADLNEDGRIDWADVQIALDWFGWSRR